MPSRRPAFAHGWGALLLVAGCGANANPEPAAVAAEVEAVQVTTLTTVQASSGLFVSPSAEQAVPDYVGRGMPGAPVPPMNGLDLAKVDVAVLFQSATAELSQVTAELRASNEGERSPIDRYFPAVVATANGASWPIELRRDGPRPSASISSEWSGWQAFGGLGVGQPGSSDAIAAAATFDFEVRGSPSPLVLTGDVGDLVVTNRSARMIERGLLVYSHPAGVAVTVVGSLAPGDSSFTALGPKEHPPGRLLELARQDLREFFSVSLGEQLGAALADAKSIPFLETQGLRLISLLSDQEAPATLELAGLKRPHPVVVSHSEVLKPDEEARIMSVVADESLDSARVASELGRFSEGKLELAAARGDAAVRARAEQLLEQLRSR